MSEEVKETEEWAEPLTQEEVDADDFGEEIEEEPVEKPNLYMALALLSTKKGYVAPGMVTELNPATAEILIKQGKVRPLGDG